MTRPCAYSSETPFLCNRWDAINDSVFTGIYEPIQWERLNIYTKNCRR